MGDQGARRPPLAVLAGAMRWATDCRGHWLLVLCPDALQGEKELLQCALAACNSIFYNDCSKWLKSHIKDLDAGAGGWGPDDLFPAFHSTQYAALPAPAGDYAGITGAAQGGNTLNRRQAIGLALIVSAAVQYAIGADALQHHGHAQLPLLVAAARDARAPPGRRKGQRIGPGEGGREEGAGGQSQGGGGGEQAVLQLEEELRRAKEGWAEALRVQEEYRGVIHDLRGELQSSLVESQAARERDLQSIRVTQARRRSARRH